MWAVGHFQKLAWWSLCQHRFIGTLEQAVDLVGSSQSNACFSAQARLYLVPAARTILSPP